MENFSRIKSRLTFLYTTVFTGLTLVSVTVFYVAIWMNIESTAAKNLGLSAQQLANVYELSRRDPGDQVNFEDVADSLSEDNTTYRIWNDAFEVVEQAENSVVDEDTAFYLIQKFFHNRNESDEFLNFDQGSNSYKICTSAYVGSSGELIMVQLVKNMSEQRQILEGPLMIMIVISLVAILISYLLGNFLAGRALAPIRRSYEQQRDFLADASHELRTPVAVVLANLEALMAHKDETVRSQMVWLENAKNETVLTKDMIENLLFLAKADSGQMVTEFKPVDLSYLVLEISERLSGLAEKKGIELTTDISDFELYVLGDEKRLGELLTILIDNAVKYTNTGGRVSITVDATASTVSVSIEDTGIGIAPAEREKIFSRFYRVDKARSRSESGTGLGLSIANTIIQEHKIGLSLESQEDVGSCFRLDFNRISPPEE